jgi:ribosome-associated heat shock protein Hsp15
LPPADAQRIDKWLFFARIVKTRSLAAKIVEGGQVRVNRAKVSKPATLLAPGDVITLALHGRVKILKVLGFSQRRGPASEAGQLYEDLSAAQKHVPNE